MRTIAIAAVAVTFFALSGVAFACGGGGGCQTWGGGYCSDHSGLIWVSPASVAPSATWVGCTISHTDSTLTVSVSNLVPGANCRFQGTLQNTGHTTLHLFSQIRAKEGPGCSWFVYLDNVVGAAHPPTLAPGHTFTYAAQISLSASAGNACQGAYAAFAVTISSSGSNSCEGYPFAFQFGPYGGDTD